MSILNVFNRPATDVAARWKDDATLVKAQKRKAELDAIIESARERLAERHEALVAEAEAAVTRAENEVLAGIGSESALADKQAALIAAKRARALDIIAKENAEAEQAKLAVKLADAERKAQRAAQKALRANYLSAARDLAAALEAVAQADARLTAIQADATSQFPRRGWDAPEPAVPPSAGLPEVGRTRFNYEAHLLQYVKPAGQAHDWLGQVNGVIAAVEKLQAELDG